MKLATEIKISYDADAQQHNIHVTSLNKPKQPAADNLEHIPLPAIPANSKRDDSKEKFIKDLPTYDDSCIFLRSIDLQDNTVAYIPAAITIVPSPTEEIMQHWMESNNLKANIKDATKSGNNNKQQTTDNLISKHQGQQQHCNGKQHVVETKATDTGTYVTHLPSTPNGIQLTRSTTNVNTKQHNTQMCM
ncbi:hypothetical protein DOY81_003210 [Sarcophaga bullata]|nr:hypothetical protein DOY81_003210 [Sarcophaga bullata]